MYGHLRPEQPEIIYQTIKNVSSPEYPVEKMCLILEISRSGYYAWGGRGPSNREKVNVRILNILKASHTKAEGMIGLDKMWEDVKEAGIQCGRNRVYKIQRENKLYSVRKKPFRVCITDSNHNLPKAPNLLNQDFHVDKPNAVWVTEVVSFIITD